MKVLLAIGLVGLAALASDDTPRYAPKEGAQLVRTWESRIELDLEKWELRIDDREPMDVLELGLGFDMQIEHNRQLELTDTFTRVNAGRPERVERAFTTIAAKAKATRGSERFSSETKFEGTSRLAGERVVFERDGDAWKVGFADGSRTVEELLAGLEQDLDFSAWLPGRSVEIGERWKIEARTLDALLRPGGALKLELKASGASSEAIKIIGASPDLWIGEFEGDVDATLVAVDSKDGARLARIRLEVDARAEKDLREVIRELNETAGHVDAGTLEDCTDVLTWEAEGALVWDIAAGRMRSLELDGHLDVAYRIHAIGEPSGYGTEWDHRMSFHGKLAVELEVGEP